MKNANVHVLRAGYTQGRATAPHTVLTGEVMPSAVSLPLSRRHLPSSRQPYQPEYAITTIEATATVTKANNGPIYAAIGALVSFFLLGMTSAYFLGQASNRPAASATPPLAKAQAPLAATPAIVEMSGVPHGAPSAALAASVLPPSIPMLATPPPSQVAIVHFPNQQVHVAPVGPIMVAPPPPSPSPPVASVAQTQATVQAAGPAIAIAAPVTTVNPVPKLVSAQVTAPPPIVKPMAAQVSVPTIAKPLPAPVISAPPAAVPKPIGLPVRERVATSPILQKPAAGGAIPLQTITRAALGLEALSSTIVVLRDPLTGAPRSYTLGDDIPGLGVLRMIDPMAQTLITAERAVRLID